MNSKKEGAVHKDNGTERNMAKTITFVFEVDPDVSGLQMHEALCKAIHEGDEDQRQWLEDKVMNIEIGTIKDDN